MADYGFWQGAERATGRAAEAGMGLLNYKAGREDAANRLAVEQDRLKLAQDQGQREKQAFEYQQKQQGEVDARNNRLIDITVTPHYLSGTPEEQKTWLNYFASNGFTDAMGKGKTVDVLTGIETISKSKELSEAMMGPRVENMKKATLSAYAELQDAIAKNPEDKKIPELQAAYKKATMVYLGSAGKLAEHLSALELAESKKVEKQPGTTPAEIKARALGVDLNTQEGAKATSDALQKDRLAAAQATVNISGGFGDLDKEDQEFYYQQYAADKTKPDFYYRDPKSKNAFNKGFAEYQRTMGQTGGETVTGRASVDSLKKSLAKQQANRGAMGSFVTNINGQVSRLEQISQDVVSRVGIRALDLPMREFKTKFIGSGEENVMAAYMKEVSSEIAKLSQGSTASIAMLPEDNRKEWEKIHDVNLSMRELIKVLNGTREMANIRLGSVDKELSRTEEEMRKKTGGVSNKNNDPLGIR